MKMIDKLAVHRTLQSMYALLQPVSSQQELFADVKKAIDKMESELNKIDLLTITSDELELFDILTLDHLKAARNYSERYALTLDTLSVKFSEILDASEVETIVLSAAHQTNKNCDQLDRLVRYTADVYLQAGVVVQNLCDVYYTDADLRTRGLALVNDLQLWANEALIPNDLEITQNDLDTVKGLKKLYFDNMGEHSRKLNLLTHIFKLIINKNA